MTHTVNLVLNGERRAIALDDPRVTLLDLLRERLDLTGTKKGCDRGQCGACTVIVDGRRVNACMSLAVTLDGAEVTTIEGLARNGELHPVQAAFIEHDGLQCGYCTPGQICSGVAVLEEIKAGIPSHVTVDLDAAPRVTEAEIRERMSGNICRCGAHRGIIEAVLDARTRMADAEKKKEQAA